MITTRNHPVAEHKEDRANEGHPEKATLPRSRIRPIKVQLGIETDSRVQQKKLGYVQARIGNPVHNCGPPNIPRIWTNSTQQNRWEIRNDKLASAQIHLRLPEAQIFKQVSSCKTTKVTWYTLSKIYEMIAESIAANLFAQFLHI